MKISINKTILIVLGAMIMNSCSKQTTDPLLDQRPDVPVSITNATEFRPDPTVTSSLAAGGKIQIVLSIPEAKGRTITEITKISTSNTYTQIQTGSAGTLYVATPIVVNGTSFTYNTTIAQYFVKNPPHPTANPPATANFELAYRFYFLVKLDDGTQLITTPVRILVLA